MYKTFTIKAFFTAVILIWAGFTAGTTQAQQVYGNEWIDYSKTYHKLQVVETGLYKLDYAYLQQLGLESVNPQHLQLFRRGKEVPIYVAGETDGRLDPQDYMEFYGERNDGALDEELYKNPAHQVHQLYSMYTDTAAYFLTVNPAGGNRRMREVNPSPNGLTPEPYHWQKAVLLSTSNYSIGKAHSEPNNYMPWMDEGEGYFSAISTAARILTFELSGISNVETSGVNPALKLVTVGPNEGSHKFDVNVTGAANRTLANIEYGSFGVSKTSHGLNFSDINLSNGKFSFQFVPQSVNGAKAVGVGLAYAQLVYPQKSIFSGPSMFIYSDSTRSGNLYYEFAQVPATVVGYDVTVAGDVIRIPGSMRDGKKGFVLSSSNQTRKVLLADLERPLLPASFTRGVRFRDIKPGEHNFIIITNKALMKRVGGSSLPAPVEYASYRSSAAGGGYDTLLVFMDDLVNQFHYGEFSSNSIRRFCSFLNTSEREKHLLLLGKGVEHNTIKYRDPAARAFDLVPTFGYPASDLLFSADFRNNSYVPSIATGRVFARTPVDVINYLNKVKEYDALPDGLEWRKNVLHLGGGRNAAEIRRYGNFIKNYSAKVRGPLLGANVIEKTRQNLSEVVESVNISNEVNEGLSLITFFGHSGPGVTDLDIGYPSIPSNNYKNAGKYPVILVNGCNIGNSYVVSDPYVSNFVPLGEDWVNVPNKGAIAFIAHSATGYDRTLDKYSSIMYSVAFNEEEHYGETLGKVQKEVIRRTLQTYRNTSDEVYAITQVLEVVIQGDPAIHLYNPAKPDYLIKANSFDLRDRSGSVVTAASDSLILHFEVKNLGKAITDSVYIFVKRTFPDNSVIIHDSIKVGPIYLGSPVAIRLPNSGPSILGINTFEVKLDSPNNIEELNEENNTATYQRFISASGLATVYPVKYSIVGNNNISLTAQSTIAQEGRGIYFEIDTTNTFDSSWRKSTTVEKSNFATWDVNLIDSARDSIVYFWRARFSTYSLGEDTIWVDNSFRHIPDVKTGWSQSHKGQFTEAKADAFKPVKQNTDKWEFKEVRKFLSLRTVGGNVKFAHPPQGFYIDGDQVLNWQCGDPNYNRYGQLFMVVYNDATLEALTNLGGTVTCSATPYLFTTLNLSTAANRAKIKRFIDAVPEGYYVAIMTANSVPFEAFPEDAKAAFRSIGSKLIDELKTGDPFVIVGRKGAAPGTAQERTYSKEEAEREGGIDRASQSIVLDVTLESHRQSGTITSTTIGPALKWSSLHHSIKPYAGGDDTYKLSLIGINTAGEEIMLVDEVNTRNFDISHIDANQYPNLKLSAFLSDATRRTAPQLKEWFVLYDPVPEGVIRPDLVKASSEELTQLAGRGTLTVPMAFQNVTSTAFTDSLTVEVVFSGSGISSTTSRFKIKPVGPNETVYFNHTLATSDLDGDYRISFYVNPRLILEQEYSNNIYEVDFGVKSRLHPIMDVAFDGIHILDGDIVSPSPLISVTVKDENRHVFLQDPSKMSVVLITEQEGGHKLEKDINLVNNPEVTYTPATETNDFKLEYRPAKLLDGSYTLQVRATDAAGKESGVSPYKIGFKVVGESSISNFYPFPNPFSTKTNFIFTITGSTIPENIKIQILTVTGKVVKEIMKEELGPLRIGNNKTEYAWDGTDMYGDKLANGVYLYRVVMTRGEEEMKHRNTFGDGAFKNGYGKLYILR